MNKKSPIIVALDVSNKEKAVSLVKELKDYVHIFKIGPVLFTKYGPDVVKEVQGYGCNVFLDLKLYDIPNTVALTAKAIAELNIAMFTVHISGGKEMLEAAVNVIKEAHNKPKILGVTVLTSVSNTSTKEVLDKVHLAKEAGLDGVISSPLEIKDIRKIVGEDFLIVTPGIRPTGAETGDQKRIATPKIAIRNGADYLVIGRPIIEASNPQAVVKQIISEISAITNVCVFLAFLCHFVRV